MLWKTVHQSQSQLMACGLTLLVLSGTGCSGWRWPGTNTADAERLTRVIHTENSRLKDLVVQLRSSNEDMAQRALDDSARIAKLEEANQALTTSVAAYQAERERMARSFQTLQQQVQVVLSDRGHLAASSSSNGSTDKLAGAISRQSVQPPEGRLNLQEKRLELNLTEWFIDDTAILRKDQEVRLARLAKWLELNADNVINVAYGGIDSLKDNRIVKTSLDDGKLNDKISSQPEQLNRTRCNRLWEQIVTRMNPEMASKIRHLDLNSRNEKSQTLTNYPSLLILMDRL